MNSRKSFNEANFIKKLEQITNSHDELVTLSLWILHYKTHSKIIVQNWLKVYHKASSSRKLALFNLANFVLQQSKKKSVNNYLNEFQNVVLVAVKNTTDDNIFSNIFRMLDIWENRSIYSKQYIQQLRIEIGSHLIKDKLIEEISKNFPVDKVISKLQDDVRNKQNTSKSQTTSMNFNVNISLHYHTNNRDNPTIAGHDQDHSELTDLELSDSEDEENTTSINMTAASRLDKAFKSAMLYITFHSRNLLSSTKIISTESLPSNSHPIYTYLHSNSNHLPQDLGNYRENVKKNSQSVINTYKRASNAIVGYNDIENKDSSCGSFISNKARSLNGTIPGSESSSIVSLDHVRINLNSWEASYKHTFIVYPALTIEMVIQERLEKGLSVNLKSIKICHCPYCHLTYRSSASFNRHIKGDKSSGYQTFCQCLAQGENFRGLQRKCTDLLRRKIYACPDTCPNPVFKCID